MPLNVAFFWHMHQPDYVDPDRKVAMLPWVRLHAAKGYYDMARLAKEFPTVPLTFNLTPVLVKQMLELQRGEVQDAWMELTRTPADRLTAAQHVELLRHFFSLSHQNMVQPYSRYDELLRMRGTETRPAALEEAARRFVVGEWRDLQVWFNLAWCGYFAVRDIPELAALRKKGRGFTEADKKVVLDAHLELVRRSLAEYRELNMAGRIEVTASPFYHPIMPLVYNTDFTRRCMPGTPLPTTFAFPEDVREHLERAAKFHEEVFGKRPTGLWPSEGSVCPELAPLVRAAGFEWMATDEEILFRSLQMMHGNHTAVQHEELFHAYRLVHGDASVGMCFRDRGLSDFIGFTAARQKSDDAARFLVDALGTIATQAREPDALALILLDGENAWESFPVGGETFLRKLYGALATDGRFKPVTLTNYFRQFPPKRDLTTLHTGSWIYANFDIWIGDQEENRAWELLREARHTFAQVRDSLPEPARKAALQSLLAAEGSDWFWWYGPEFQIEDKPLFDDLFRRHIRCAYRAMGRQWPAAADHSLLTVGPVFAYQEPRDLVTPVIDGRQTSFYEWQGAGVYRGGGGQHAMAKSADLVKEICFGFDRENFYLGLQWTGSPPIPGGDAVRLKFTVPRSCELVIDGLREKIKGGVRCQLGGEWARRETAGGKGVRAAHDRMLEVAIPLELFGQSPGQKLAFQLRIESAGQAQEQHPGEGVIALQAPSSVAGGNDWLV
ncbi:MAG: glycoside hydrolase family 57 protein [Verrucomicrobia bacterium]|nr:glycoside hydrolase family 57 protein [Verrucomicrobiota bacterium]